MYYYSDDDNPMTITMMMPLTTVSPQIDGERFRGFSVFMMVPLKSVKMVSEAVQSEYQRLKSQVLQAGDENITSARHEDDCSDDLSTSDVGVKSPPPQKCTLASDDPNVRRPCHVIAVCIVWAL